ncbi:conserved hypothetical protein [Histoplasma capsulatum var. duboisii H88]|uniref:Uncharacterized protein n=1 Tax=Ajellomyces capsulatus (strain H88) TaxID=544711 RepID=F0U923_AJEC8|nr:conserved hypothetical protein [Histoplasma capsulatum var. duboisii H88]QSS51762.1 hypothetical protein I7I53_07180 [Histoplasma capsulatum var. duboisii H88]
MHTALPSQHKLNTLPTSTRSITQPQSRYASPCSPSLSSYPAQTSSPPPPPSPSSSSSSSSPAPSPSTSPPSASPPSTSSVRYSSTPPPSHPSRLANDPLLDAWNGAKSNDADQQVKLALTELLNSAPIKTDHEGRMWVQKRLMDTEHRLKARRRSRISGLGLQKDGAPVSGSSDR